MRIFASGTKGLIVAGLVLAACATTTTLPRGVVRVGGIYYVPAEGVEVNGDDGFRLEPGDYRFATDVPGYRTLVHDVVIEDGSPRWVQVAPGVGYASAEFAFTPEAHSVSVSRVPPAGPPVAMEWPWKVDLDEGRYVVEAVADGRYLPLVEEFTVSANDPVSLDLNFALRPTTASLLVVTDPAGAELHVDGEVLGETPMRVEDLDFGSRLLEAYLETDTDQRRAWVNRIEFHGDFGDSFELTKPFMERRVDGRWVEWEEAERVLARRREEAEREARRAEEGAYRSARVDEPFEIRLEMESLPEKGETTLEDFSRALHGLLRVGDRVRVVLGGSEYLAWKRSRRRGDEFLRQVDALWRVGTPRRVDFAADRVASVSAGRSGARLLDAVAIALYEGTNDYPIVDLRTEMHELEALSFHVTAEDGEIALVILGSGEMALNGEMLRTTAGLAFRRLATANRLLELSWREAPSRVLVVSEANSGARPTAVATQLKQNQKGLATLGVGGRVRSFHRFTLRPDGAWRHLEKRRGEGPFSSVNLNGDEVGPHAVSGSYRREWLVTYETAVGVAATRQVAIDYVVTDEEYEAGSREYIRRRNQ